MREQDYHCSLILFFNILENFVTVGNVYVKRMDYFLCIPKIILSFVLHNNQYTVIKLLFPFHNQ